MIPNVYFKMGNSIIIGLSIIIGCMSIAYGMKSQVPVVPVEAPKSIDATEELREGMSLSQAAEFLGLDESQMRELVSAEASPLSKYTENKLPFIRLDTEYIFSRTSLIIWFNQAVNKGQVYSKGERKN